MPFDPSVLLLYYNRSMFDRASNENGGPLSDEGLRAFYTELLALTKRELAP